ncbi:PHP domain-containing protein [Photobacterium sp. GJ3]|uniref:PHP domain-containing protein n=1 Tax=Photobacterium sp. GJ3 TaxID=2829502 RepID=UPI001B8D8059|nr:PHP domain-containing protein [Photobacterium sp. GJ3]QUJ66793.1 PHP domain-containing protein [Photobacterium sp. GJ3]
MKIYIDLHAHTLASDHAYSTVHEYIQVAQSKQLEMIAITDHGPSLLDSPHEWHFYNMKSIPRRLDGIRILKGIEANIQPDGTIDCNPSMVKALDFVMAGFHPPIYPPSEDKDKNTDVLLKVIQSNEVSIITHPGNPQYPIHHEIIAQAAKENHVALEINNASDNARPGSHDNCKSIIEAVKKVGGLISIGSDAHYCSQIGEFSNAISLLNHADFPHEQVVNHSLEFTLDFFNIQ